MKVLTLFHFLNFYRRAKEKRLKKDAGRQRWSPYFSRGKRGGGSDDNDPLDDMSKDSIDGYGSKCFMQFCLLHHIVLLYYTSLLFLLLIHHTTAL